MASIDELNERFFGRNKAKEYIICDLTVCVERLVYVHILDAIMLKASEKYESFHKETRKGPSGTQTIISLSDPLYFRELSIMQGMAYDAMFLAIRKLFANSNSDTTSGGALLKELKGYGKDNFLNAIQIMYETKMKIWGYKHFQVVKRQDLKSCMLELDNGGIIATEKLFSDGTIVEMITSEDDPADSIALYSSSCARDFLVELDALYDRLYSSPEGKKNNNYGLIKEYERYQFHKDEWEDGEKYVLTRKIREDDLLGKVTVTNKRLKYKIEPFELHNLLEDFAKLLEHYMSLCLFSNSSWNWEVCHSYTSLENLMERLNDTYSNRLSPTELQAEVDKIREHIPHCLKIIRLK